MLTSTGITVSDNTITLNYDQALSTTNLPALARFTVTVGGTTVTPTARSISGSSFNIDAGFHIAPDETVTVAYSKPTGASATPIQNSSGEEADSFAATTATNTTTINPWSATAFDASASETSLAGHVVALVFTDALSSTASNPSTSAFTVTVDGTAQTPGAHLYRANPASTGGNGLVALQTLPTAIKSGQTVQASYAPPLGAMSTVSSKRLFGADGNLVQRFTTQAVTNRTALVANTTKGTQSIQTTSRDQAQAFTTGSRAIRLDAASLRVQTSAGHSFPPYAVRIHSSNASDQPGDSLAALTLPASASLPDGDVATVRFEAPSGGIVLAADTTYFVVMDVSVGPSNEQLRHGLRNTDSDDEDAGRTTDWSIANARLDRLLTSTGDFSPALSDAGNSLVMAVHGAPVAPTLASAAVNGTALTLTFNATLDSGSTPPASAFTVSGDHSATGTALDQITSTTLSIVLDSAVSHGQTVTVGYSKPTGMSDAPLKDTCDPCAGANAALEVATFSGKAVENNTGDPEILVSNTGQTTIAGNFEFGTIAGSHWSMAQTFTTGTNTAGYTLTAVDVELASGTHSPNTRVSIYDTSSGSPSTSLRVLTNPSPLTASATNTFTAASGLTLTANTTYAVVFEVPGGTGTARLAKTASNAEDSGKASGWGIGDRRHERLGTGVWNAPSGTDFDKLRIAIKGTASTGVTPPPGTPPVIVPPPDTDPPSPPSTGQPQTDRSGGSEQRPRDPLPLQLALWTDKPGYRAGESVRLYRSLEPHDDRGRYRAFVYLERSDGEERRWLAPLSAEGELHAEAVDAHGAAASASRPRGLIAADRELAFEGEAPGPGLWQFVLELRPGEPSEQAQEPVAPTSTRRAWAKFAVAERSVLLNRAGFDREIRSDMTLRADTLYYLGHQLFVHAGATLAIEPGTLLQAFGSHAAIIVEPGGRIVAEGTREAPVVLTCSAPAGYRQPGCWAGLRILGRAPVTRLQGVAPGVLPPERPVYGGSDAEGSSGALRHVRVEFAGASDDPEAPGPAIGLYGAGSGTLLERVQARASLGDGFAFHGGTAVCDHCVASRSGRAGLSWERGWRGGAAHLYVQHGRGGGDGLAGGHDEQGHDREPRSLPDLSNVTLVHGAPYDRDARRAVALRLSSGSGVQVRDLLAAHFGGGALRASGRSRLLFGEGESALNGALLWLNGSPQLPGSIAEAADFNVRNPKLRDVRDFASPDPRPKPGSPALTHERQGYIGAFGRKENWLEEWTVFGPESAYDLRERDEEDN